MKPKNFPARKDARRARALRSVAQAIAGTRASKLPRGDNETLAYVIQGRLSADARAIRTKKDRSTAGRVSR